VLPLVTEKVTCRVQGGVPGKCMDLRTANRILLAPEQLRVARFSQPLLFNFREREAFGVERWCGKRPAEATMSTVALRARCALNGRFGSASSAPQTSLPLPGQCAG